MNNDLRILLGVAINAEQAIKTLNTQISELSKKVDSIKLNIGIDDKVLSQLNQLANNTNLVKNATDNLNKVIKQEETVIKNLDGSVDKLIKQYLASGAVIEKTRQTIDKNKKAKEADIAATIRLTEVEDQYGKKLKETQRLNSKGELKGSSTTFGNKYNRTTVNTDAEDKITGSKVVANIEKQAKDIEKVEQQHNDELRKVSNERKLIRQQLQSLDSTGKLTDTQKNLVNQSLVSSKSIDDIQRIKGIMTQIETSIKAQIQYQTEQNKVLAQQYQQAQKIADKETTRINGLGQKKGSNISDNVFARDYIQASANMEKYIKSVYGANTTVTNLQRTVNSAGQEVWKFNASLDQGSKKTQVIKGNIDRTTASMYELSRSMKEVNNSSSMMHRLTTALETIPAWLVSTSLIFGSIRGFKEMVNVIIDVDTAMTNLKKVMNLDTNFDEVMDSAIAKSQEFAKTITDTLDSFEVFARQGFDQKQINDMASAALIASNVGEIKTADAAGYLTSAIVQMKLETKDAMSVVDAWNNISNKNATTVENLAQGMAKAGSTARSFGLDMNQLNAIVGTVTAATKQSGTEVGNFVKSVLPRLMTKDAQSALSSINVAIKDQNGEMRNAAEIYGDVAEQFKKMGASQRNAVAQALAGTYQVNRMNALLSNWDIYEKQLTDSINSKNSALSENATYMQSAQAKIELLKGSFQQLALAIGEAFLSDGFVGSVQILTSIAQGATALVKAIGALPVIFSGASTAVLIFNKSLMASVISSEVAQAAFTALGVTARSTQAILATTGVGLALAAVGFALEKVISYYSKLHQEQQQAEAQAKRYSEASQDALLNESDKLNSLLMEYKDLSARKQSGTLDAEDNKEYLKVSQELSSLFPNLISYIDAKGVAHLKEAEEVDKVVASTKELIRLQKEKIQLDAKDNFSKSQGKINDLNNQITKGSPNILLPGKDTGLEFKLKVAQDSAELFKDIPALRDHYLKQVNDIEQQIAQARNKIAIESAGINQQILKVADSFNSVDSKIDPNVKQKLSDLVMSLDTKKLKPEELEQASKIISTAMENISKAVDSGNKGKLDAAIAKLKKDLNSIGVKDSSLKSFKVSLDDSSKSMDDTSKKAENLSERVSAAMEAGIDPTDMLAQSVKDAGNSFDGLSESVLAYAKAGQLSESLALAQGDAYKALADEISPLNDLLEKMAHGKEISASEAMDLISKEHDLADAISIENGVVQINQDAVLALRDAKVKSYQDMIVSIQTEVQAQSNALKVKLKNYGIEIQGILSVAQANEALAAAQKKYQEETDQMNHGYGQSVPAYARSQYQSQYQDIVSSINDIKSSYEAIDKLSALTSTSLEQVGTSAEKLSDSSDKANDKTKESIYLADQYKQAQEKLNLALEEQRKIKSQFADRSKEYRAALQQEINLLKEQKKLIDGQTSSLSSQIASGNIRPTGLVDASSLSSGGSTGALTVTSSSSNYGNGDVRNISNVSAAGLNQYLKGALSGMGDAIISAGKANGIDPAFLAAIAMHESGNGSSNAVRNKNNAFGIMSSSGGIRVFSSLAENINYEADMLRRLYVNQGLTTIPAIQKKYAPVGASNDPYGQNKDWQNGVTAFWNKFKSGASSAVSSVVSAASSSVKDYYLNNFRITSEYGEDRGGSPHKGVDFANGHSGDPVKAIASGKVITATYSSTAGNWVVVQQDDGTVAKYMHMLNGSLAVKAGDNIVAGQQLGKVGSTGDSSGAHLHLQVERNGQAIDPLAYLKSSGGTYSSGSSVGQDFTQEAAEAAQAIDQAKSDVLSLQQESLQVQQQIQQLYMDMVNSNLTWFDYAIQSFDDELSKIDYDQSTMNKYDPAFMSNEVSREDIYQTQINYSKEAVEYLKQELAMNKQLTEAQRNMVEDKLAERYKELWSLEQKLYDRRIELGNEVIDTYKKAVEAQKDIAVKTIDKMLDEINKEADAADYKKKLGDAQKDRQDIVDEMTKLMLDDSPAAKKKLADLQKQLSEQDDNILTMQTDKSKQDRIDNLNTKKDETTAYYDNILNDEAKFDQMRENIVKMSTTQIQNDLTAFSANIQANAELFGTSLAQNLVALINRANGYIGNIFIKPISPAAFDTGGYTGENFGSSGKLAVLHEKEIVLNKDDTSNFLKAINFTRNLVSNLKIPSFSTTPSPAMATSGGNTYNLSLSIGEVTGDKNGAQFVWNQLVNGIKSIGGDI